MTQLENIILTMSYETLSPALLHKCLFKALFFIQLYGVVTSISPLTFKDFNSLKKVDIQVENFQELFHSGTTWMIYLNEKINVNLNEINLDLTYMAIVRLRFPKNEVSFTRVYSYPNEDICLFKAFPHTHLVYALLEPGERLVCTCTLLWLQYYARLYDEKNKIKIINDYSLNYENNLIAYLFCDQMSLMMRECNFEARFNSCSLSETTIYTREKGGMNDVDVLFLIRWLQFILLTLLQPILCFMGKIYLET